MNNYISRRDRFVAHQFPDEYIERERVNAPFRPHSLGVLICEPKLMYFVACIPRHVFVQDPLASLVPLQLRLNSGDRKTNVHPMSIYDVSVAVANQVLTIRPSFKAEQMQYLGSTYGNHEAVKSKSKQIHWMGLVLPPKYRQDGFHSLLQNSDNFSEVSWLSFREWGNLNSGAVTSSAKYRMVLQALVSLAAKSQKSSIAVRAAHKQLKDRHPDLLPQQASFAVAN